MGEDRRREKGERKGWGRYKERGRGEKMVGGGGD